MNTYYFRAMMVSPEGVYLADLTTWGTGHTEHEARRHCLDSHLSAGFQVVCLSSYWHEEGSRGNHTETGEA